MTTRLKVNALATTRRKKRWAKEEAARAENLAHDRLTRGIATWKGVSIGDVRYSNIHCNKAPADLNCTFVESGNPFHNKCIFCGAAEECVY